MAQRVLAFAVSAFRHSPNAMIITDAQSAAIVEVNQPFCDLFGHRREAVLGRTAVDIGLWGDLSARNLLLESLSQEGGFEGTDLVLKNSTGRPVPVLCSGNRFETEGREYNILVLLDQSERIQLREANRQAEASFRNLFHGSPILLAISELETGRFIECNEAFCTVTGYPRDEVIGTVVFELPLWDDPSIRLTIMGRLKEQESVQGLEIKFWSRTGQELWGRGTFSRLNHGGKLCILASIDDITATKALANELQLQRSFLEYLFENSEDPMYLKDRHGRFLQCNEALAQTIGDYTAAEVRGRLQRELMAPAALLGAEASDQAVLKEGVVHRHEQVFDVGGVKKHMASTKGPWRNGAGEIVGIIGVAHDITAIREHQQHLARQNSMKDRLFTVLAHDLKGPVGTSNHFLGLIRDQVQGQPDLEQAFDLLQASSNNTYQLLVSVLSWVQGRISGEVGQRESRDLGDTLQEVADWLSLPARQKGLSIQVSTETATVVSADHKTLQTIVRNLLSNAVKYSSPGSGIVVRARRIDGELWVEVEDHGQGMTEERRSKLLGDRRIDSEEGTAGEGGHGLGLLFTADLVRDMGGQIEVESTLGVGSLFRVRIPQ